MPQTRQHIYGERPLRQNYTAEEGVLVVWDDIQGFLTAYGRLNRSEGTLQYYRRKLRRFYQDLPEDKTVRHGTLRQWQEALLQCGYTPGAVNAFLSAANAFLDYIGHREYQLAGQLKEEKPPPPQLSRAEYLQLLHTARRLGKERVYLLIKVFAMTGLFVQELPEVTVEAAREGQLDLRKAKGRPLVKIPGCLQKELLNFAGRNSIHSGPIFLARSGNPAHRTSIATAIRGLCKQAKIPAEKGNPRCLRKLYLSTRAGIESNVFILVEQAMEQMVEREQFSIGWEER